MVTSRELGTTRLPLWAAGFVVLICVTILGLSAWREWETRNADLRNAEVDMANLAHSLIQHADDTFELADTILVGLVSHLAGDGCLRALSRILSAHARRPADLAARYGGEEFALLLPNTGPDGCAEVAQAIRKALHDLAMLHVQDPPSRLVTVSLGGAASLPSETTADSSTLVAAADRALYAAKDSGRDRLVMSGQVVPWRAKTA